MKHLTLKNANGEVQEFVFNGATPPDVHDLAVVHIGGFFTGGEVEKVAASRDDKAKRLSDLEAYNAAALAL
jgi:hypothetical protein